MQGTHPDPRRDPLDLSVTARTLGFLFGGGSGLLAASLLLPHPYVAREDVVIAVSLGGLGVMVAILRGPGLLPARAHHVVLVAATVLLSAVVYAAEGSGVCSRCWI